MHIFFITTSNLATNPRTLKEIRLALKYKHRVTLLCFSFNNWSKEINSSIKDELETQINYIELPGNRKPLMPWLFSTLTFALAGIVLKLMPTNTYWLSVRSNKRSWLLMRHLKRTKERPELVVAHNIGSFYPGYLFAKRTGARFGIDLEDYHPGESNDAAIVRNSAQLLQNILPLANYLSAASPLILKESLKLATINCPSEVILNYFSRTEFIEPAPIVSDHFRLVWFSQNISFGRGLEHVIPVIEKLDGIELHLFGNCDNAFKDNWLGTCKNIFVHDALPQSDLHKKMAEFDIGLAIEQTNSNYNRELCITNKILAYFQAGLYIVASDTEAQKLFLHDHPAHGSVYPLQSGIPDNLFTGLIQKKEAFRAGRRQRFHDAAASNWENESEKLINLWRETTRDR